MSLAPWTRLFRNRKSTTSNARSPFRTTANLRVEQLDARLTPTTYAGPNMIVNEGQSFRIQGQASGNATAIQWDFGDRTTAAGTLTPTKTYAEDGTYTVTLIVTYRNRREIDTATITVNNVAPTATFTNSGPVNPGQTATVSFTSPKDPSSIDTAAGFRYSYDFDNDGTFDLANSTSASATVPASFLSQAGTRVVRGRIADQDGGYTDYTTSIAVGGPPVSATFDNGGAVNEGATGSVAFTNATGGNGNYTYSYDFDNNGTFEISGSNSASSTVPASFLADGAGSRVVRGRVTDSAGSFADYTTSIGVLNVAPTANAGGPYSGLKGSAIAFNGSATDPSSVDTAAGLAYAWNFGDGTTGTGGNVTHAYASAGTYSAKLTVTDKDGASTTQTVSVTVTSPSLSASFGNAGAVNEGSVGTVSFANVSGGSGGYTYSYDFDNDGTFDISGSGSTLVPVPASYLADGPGGRTVRGRVSDSSGAFADFTTTIAIINVAPTPNAGGPYGGIAGAAIAFSGSATDASSADTAAGFTYTWVFGDGSTASGKTVDHTYNNAGDYTATLTVTDKDGASSSQTFSVSVGSSTFDVLWVDDSTPAGASLNGAQDGWNWVSSPTPVSGGLAHQSMNIAGIHQHSFTGGSLKVGLGDRLFAYVYLDPASPPKEIMLQWYSGGWGHNAYWGANTILWGTDGTASRAYVGPLPAVGQWVRLEVPASMVGLAGQTVTGMSFTLYDGRATWDAAGKLIGAEPIGVIGSFANNGSVNEGSSGAVSFSGVAGGSGSYTYSYDFNNDGTFEITNSNSPSATVPASYLTDGPAVRTVRGRASDSLGAYTDFTTDITVNNLAPTVVALPAGQTLTARTLAGVNLGSFDDAGLNDGPWSVTVNWGDSTTSSFTSATRGTLNSNHNYATNGTYTVTVTLTDKSGASSFASNTVTAADAGDYIVTPYDRIPNFGAHPTVVSAHSGLWSDPATWSQGRVPAAGDVVSIASNMTVTYDVVSDAAIDTVVIQAGGLMTFRTDVTTRLTVINFLVLEGGELRIGTAANPVATSVRAEISIADVPFDTVKDPEQYGHSLIGLGKVTMYGAVRNQTFVMLASEPRAGDTTLQLSQAVTGWRAGDRVVLPDTRNLVIGYETDAAFSGQWEMPTIQSVSADGKSITLTAPLQFDHMGARDGDGALTFLPHVGDLTRNVFIHSQNMKGTRGYTMFTNRAEVDIQNAQFSGLGRTTTANPDDTKFDPNGNLTHVGTNEKGRYPVYFNHLIGPVTTPASGYQFTFKNNAVFCPLTPMTFKWGIALNDSHYGLVQGNVLYNWGGAGLVTESGNESYNVIDGNFVVRSLSPKQTVGSGWERADAYGLDNVANEGVGLWFRGYNNYVRNNVTADATSYGYTYFAQYVGPNRNGIVYIPTARGQAPSQAVNMNATPILQFENNQVYGATPSGLTIWWLGTQGDDPLPTGLSTIKTLKAWHVHNNAYFGYQVNNLTIDGLLARNDTYTQGVAVSQGDYFAKGFVLTNADIQGFLVGYQPGTNPGGTQIIQDSYLRNYWNIEISPLVTSSAWSSWIPARRTEIHNVRFGVANVSDFYSNGPRSNIYMFADWMAYGCYTTNLIQKDEVFVYDYNGVVGDNFQTYYLQQAADFILPESTYNNDGSVRSLGAPVSGLTNQQAWNQFHIAWAGAVAPTSSTRSGIKGLIRPF